VTLGATTVLVYDVVPDRNATNVTVVITPGADWVVSAVIGTGVGDRSRRAAELAAEVAREGVAAVIAKLAAPKGPGCTAEWVDATGPPPEKPAAAKRPPAKRTPAPKKTTRARRTR
jgi:hypothetical protein